MTQQLVLLLVIWAHTTTDPALHMAAKGISRHRTGRDEQSDLVLLGGLVPLVHRGGVAAQVNFALATVTTTQLGLLQLSHGGHLSRV